MAKVIMGHPIVEVHGRFATGIFVRGSQQLRAVPPPKKPKKGIETCPCKSWTHADWLWSHGFVDTDQWRKAVKRPGMSGYDLWMREAVHLASQGHYFPHMPSISGGWSASKCVLGFDYQPSALCINDYISEWTVITIYKTDHTFHIRLHFIARETRSPHLGFQFVSVLHYGHGWRREPTWYCRRNRNWMRPHLYVHETDHNFWAIHAFAKDGTWTTRWAHGPAWVRPKQCGAIPWFRHACAGGWPTKEPELLPKPTIVCHHPDGWHEAQKQ